MSDVPRGFPTLAALDPRVSAGMRAFRYLELSEPSAWLPSDVSNLTLLVYPLDA